jgi:hydroxymethylglutaryl-CoA lyase
MTQRPAGKAIFIQEVAPRDGFQNEPTFVPTESKIALIDQLSRTGVAKIEVTSFTSAEAIPGLADAESVFRGIDRHERVSYTALVPNVRGAQRALQCGADGLNLVMSVSETHNLTNLRMFRAQSFEMLCETIKLAQSARTAASVSLSCAFGCPMEGEVEPDEVLSWAQRFVDLGIADISLCDTTGMAFPRQVTSIVEAFRTRCPAASLTLHFHNTRGMGLANVLAGAQAGVDRFDASLGGIGGCPYAPGASGNVCTEDVVHMLDLAGYETGVNLDALLACARSLPRLLGHDISGQVAKAGPRLTAHALPKSFAEIKARATERALSRGSWGARAD